MLQDSFLGDLVNEISMQTAATEATYAAAQATAAQLLQVSKDQYIRLNADFDNFRRRTVCCQAALFKHGIYSLPLPMRQADSAGHIVHHYCSDQCPCMQAGEKLALKNTTKGDVIVKLVPLIDNFEAAKNSIKVQSDAEQKIVDSYQVGVSVAEHESRSVWTGACALLSCTVKVLWNH